MRIIPDYLDIRQSALYPGFPPFVPEHVKKEYIKDPENYKKERDFLVNLFYAKKDWEAPHEKLFYITFLGAKIGAFYGALDVCSKDQNVWREALANFSKKSGIITAAFATYGASSCAIANIRGRKDDIYNHMFGGASVGFIFGYLNKSSAVGALSGAACSLIAMAAREFQVRNYFILHPNQKILREMNTMMGPLDLRMWEDTNSKEAKVRRNYYCMEV